MRQEAPAPSKRVLLAKVLRDSGVRLAVLTACQSALSAADDAFSSVAAQLIRSGVDAVVAMSARVLVASATCYVEALYRALGAGISIPLAQEQARRALYDNPYRHPHRRRRDEMGQPVELRDWWLPHFYQQHPFILQPVKSRSRKPKALQTFSSRHVSEEMPEAPRYGFTGRAHELLQIERSLRRGQIAIIHGFGGAGKTALAREAADWLMRTRMYDGACFVSFEDGGDAAMLLSSLSSYLGIDSDFSNTHDPVSLLDSLMIPLKEQCTLVIVDSLETILSRGEMPLEPGSLAQLWNVLLKLSEMSAGVLLTSRDTNFGDKRFLSGHQVIHLFLGGLHAEDAFTLAGNLFSSLGIDIAGVPYSELRDLLKQLGYNPLALQQVLPMLRELPISKIRSDFPALLPKFVDDTETGRHKSLLASLNYSLRRLAPELQALLPRLALFEEGAMETDLVSITQIPELTWAKLRKALRQAALLVGEQVGEDLLTPFLRFHPILQPYLRSQSNTDSAIMREGYIWYYSRLSAYLYHNYSKDPQAVQAIVKRELSNFLRTIGLLLETSEHETVTEMALYVASFLEKLGQIQELDNLQRQLVEVARDTPSPKTETLTQAEWLYERNAGEEEMRKGNLRAASSRFLKLLARIEAQQENMPLSKGSFENSQTLGFLAQCLRENGQLAAAEERLREALTIINALIKRWPDDQADILQRGKFLGDLGNILRSQGKYPQAQEVYEEALKIARQLGEQHDEAVAEGNLGNLAFVQWNYPEARSRYEKSLELFHALGDPGEEAVTWFQLGTVVMAQEEWTEAERCYRESLTLNELLGNAKGVADACAHLAIVAKRSGHPAEAEAWYKRALEMEKQIRPGSLEHANDLCNISFLLLEEVQAGHAPIKRLEEAQTYAEQALRNR